MKAITNDYKTGIKEFGRDIDSKIIYGLTVLGKEDLNSVTPHYESSLLKSVMKQLDIDSNVEIPVGTELNYQFGLNINGTYEYIDYGNYIVYSSEKQEDTRSWKIVCYDKMLYSMKPYESLGVSYPITIRNYINALCNKIGLTFANVNSGFVNSEKEIQSELYLDSEGNSLDYTYRDVLDELACATASTICINDNDELEIRYINNTGDTETATGTTISINGVEDTSFDYELEGNLSQSGTPTPTSPLEVKTVTGRQVISVNDKDYEINLGKNLLKLVDGTYSDGDITAVVENGKITINGTETSSKTFNITASFNCVQGETYTLSLNNTETVGTMESSNYASLRIDQAGNYDAKFGSIDNSNTFTANVQLLNTTIKIRTQSGLSYDNFVIYPQLERGNTKTSYSIYKEPIELCKIDEYKDFIKKSKGKNVFKSIADNRESNGITCSYDEASQTYTFNGTCTADNTTFLINDNVLDFVSGKTKSTTYWVGGTCSNYCRMRHFNDDYSVGLAYSIVDLSSSNTKITETTNLTFQCSKRRTSIRFNNGSVATDFKIKIMVSSGDDTDYEPYINGWYIEKQIGKTTFNGSEDWRTPSSTSDVINFTNLSYTSIFDYREDTDTQYSNILEWGGKANGHQSATNNGVGLYSFISDGYKYDYFVVPKTIATTVEEWKTWLSSNNMSVYYVLSLPQYIQITDENLITQLNRVKLEIGANEIEITSDLASPLSISYTTALDEIDEEYLKDINVNFGEKFGPVNSVVFSRSAESDNIYERDEESIEQNGLCEIKIKDNQILNGNNRDTFLSEVFNKLYGIEYYINDFSSTGLTFYDLLDRYKIKVGDNYYRCVMFNDEVDITQGLEEQVHTDMPEESQTDYTKSDKTDRRINQTYLIVDKQNQQISAVVQNVSQQMETIGTSLTQTIDSLNASVTSIQGILDNGVSLVKTTSVTIDDSGLNVSTDTSKISTTMSNNSFEIKSGGTPLAFFGYDENDNTQKSQMDNLTVTNYFVAGNHRIEKYKTNRTGVFYIGG